MSHPIEIAIALMVNVFVWTIVVISVVRILHRMGFSGWWVLTIGLWPLMLWILSRARWPALDEKSN